MFRKFFLVLFFWLTIIFQLNSFAYEEKESSSVPPNVGLSLNILGPLFGLYSAGVSTYVSPYVQIGLYGTYFDTRNIDPQVTGWQSQIRLNLYFTAPNVSGIYLGIFGGYESVTIKKNDNKSDSYNDLIGGFVPGYKWAMTKKLNLLLGIIIGYMYGDIQVSPEISFVYSL
ncbi:DUF3575 domain-containing protein [Pigmentibacter sp. JX0631]|uniref:DUF3575 domain-containing protein n=1 Tax=Pigmentibacter sp. JX0631 TaxID=2976982 RepID=UPI0024685A41|nr:DUF3575 domain-containing protein [Pigmentibacter sp. JX0631]WGL59513.1 DUF3575 domain-containing protein [Pigmentibacter sp. JX0631]